MMIVDFETLIGKTFKSVKQVEEDKILFDDTYSLHHEQDCCENVYIEDITGDLSDLEGVPILTVSEVGNRDNEKEETWSFYNIATIKGTVTIRFYGTSNGYYSETAYLWLLEEGESQ